MQDYVVVLRRNLEDNSYHSIMVEARHVAVDLNIVLETLREYK